MGVVDGSTNWNGQDNFVDFIQFAADKVGMTREEYMAHYGRGIDENKKPGPDPYHRGLDDDEVEDKEDQIKKQAKMDDDDPDAYKEMPGDKEAREKGEVKTSKATKAYNKLYSEALDEGTMSDIHQMAGEAKSKEDFLKKFFKEFGAKIKKSKDSEEWAASLYDDTIEEAKVNEMSMGYDGHTGLFYMKGVPFTQERLEQTLKYLRTKLKLGKLPKQFSYYPALQVADNAGMEMVTLDLQDAKKIEDALKRFKGKLAHDGDFDEEIIEASHSGNEASDKMAYSQLERIIDYATMLRDRMASGKGLDAWMYGKIVKAEDYLNTLYDVVDGDDGVVETQKMTNKDWKKIKKFNKHTTDSGEKFVMSYDDRIGTFLEPVEIVEEADDKEQKSTDRGPLDDDKIETALKKKAQDTGVPIGIIRAVMRRGLAAWKSGHRPGANQQQWGYARVNAFLTKGEGTWGNADKDLAKEVRDGGHDKKLKKA